MSYVNLEQLGNNTGVFFTHSNVVLLSKVMLSNVLKATKAERHLSAVAERMASGARLSGS